MTLSATAFTLLISIALALTVLTPIILVVLFIKDYFSKSIW